MKQLYDYEKAPKSSFKEPINAAKDVLDRQDISMKTGTELHFMVLEGLTSSWREFMALHQVYTIPKDMVRLILSGLGGSSADVNLMKGLTKGDIHLQIKPSDAGTPWVLAGLSEKFTNSFQAKFNRSQLDAIRTAVVGDGFTLVQGPPGTGKTTTVIGILNAIHLKVSTNSVLIPC